MQQRSSLPLTPLEEINEVHQEFLNPLLPVSEELAPDVAIRHAQMAIVPLEGPGGCNTPNDYLLTLEFENSGLRGDGIYTIDMPGASISISSSNSSRIGSNTGSFVTYYCANSHTFSPGQTVSFIVKMLSGDSLPVAVTIGGASLNSRPQASVRSVQLQAGALEGAGGCNTANDHLLILEFQNAGDLPDSITTINMPGATVAISGTNSSTIGPNTSSITTFYCANSSTYTVGQTVSFTLRMASGLTIPVAVTVESLASGMSLPSRSIPLSCSNPSIVFQESFEYINSIEDHGWAAFSNAGVEEAQELVAVVGERALRLDDSSSETNNLYVRTMPLQLTTFQVDFFLRSEQRGQVVQLSIWGSEYPNGIDGGILIELSENNRLRIQDRMFFTFELNKWYHVRLIISPETHRFVAYVEDMSIPIATDLPVKDTFLDRFAIATATAGVGAGFWDGIVVQECN